jgi:hypothetical protein
LNLFTNANAEFTNWVVKAGLLREPFVLVDVGVQGGEDPPWHRLGDYLVIHGFDAIEEAIDQLRKRTGGVPNRHYHRLPRVVRTRNGCSTSAQQIPPPAPCTRRDLVVSKRRETNKPVR